MQRQDLVLGQMYVYRQKIRSRSLRVYRSTVLEYRVQLLALCERSAAVALHYRNGIWIGTLQTVVQHGSPVPIACYQKATVGLRNLFPYHTAWVPLK